MGLPKSLIVHNGVEQFLEKLLCNLKVTQNSVAVYNFITIFIASLADVEYIHKEIDVLIKILNEFKKQKKTENAKLIAEKMYDIPCLKFHVEKYKEFLFE